MELQDCNGALSKYLVFNIQMLNILRSSFNTVVFVCKEKSASPSQLYYYSIAVIKKIQ